MVVGTAFPLAAGAGVQNGRMTALERAVRDRLRCLRRELEIAEREAAREPLDASFLPADQREPFDLANAEISAARIVIPYLRAEIAELEGATV